MLRRAIEAGPVSKAAFLETNYGKRYSDKGIGNAMRDWCDQAGLRHCTAHGLRKAGATIAAENGATTAQLMAIYDWSTPGQAEVYIRAANRKRLAGQAMALLESWVGEDRTETSGEHTFVAPTPPRLSHSN